MNAPIYTRTFVERAHKLLKNGGRFGMIVSNKFLRQITAGPCGNSFANSATVERVVDFAGLPVFQGATVRTIILLTRRPREDNYEVLYSPPVSPDVFQAVVGGSLPVQQAIAHSTYPVAAEALEGTVWGFARRETDDLIARLQAACVPLSKYCEGQICRGVVSGLTEAFVIDADTRAAILKRNAKAGKIIKPFLNGRNVRRYRVDPKGLYLIYTYHGVRIRDFPAVERHLQPFRAKLEQRATQSAVVRTSTASAQFRPLHGRPEDHLPRHGHNPPLCPGRNWIL